MIYDLSRYDDLVAFENQIDFVKKKQKKIELKIVQKTRTLTQNRALHKWFEFISDTLNDLGVTFNYTGLKGLDLETRFTPVIVKEVIIKPIIKTLFYLDSTTKLTTAQINELIDVINKYFSEKGIYLPFPSIQSIIDATDNF